MTSDSHPAAVAELLSHGWLKTVRWFDQIDSTSDAAKRILNDETLSLPSLVVADKQTAGRGRNQHVWWSPNGCLMQTLVIGADALPPDPTTWPQLALVCGVAVATTASRFVDPAAVMLKWPNDVYLRDKKLAGILIESAGFRGQLTGTATLPPAWMIGIGLNVDVDWSSAPTEVANRATCLSSCTTNAVAADVVLVELMEELRSQLSIWRDGLSDWLNSWQDRCLLSGRNVEIRMGPSRQTRGRCEGIDTEGRLILRTDAGAQLLSSGEVLAWD